MPLLLSLVVAEGAPARDPGAVLDAQVAPRVAVLKVHDEREAPTVPLPEVPADVAPKLR